MDFVEMIKKHNKDTKNYKSFYEQYKDSIIIEKKKWSFKRSSSN